MAIHIKEKNKGKFTRKAKAHGKGVQEFARQVLANKDNYSTATVKQANFARNFGGKKQLGGEYEELDETYQVGGVSKYNKLHPPIYLTNPKDSRIGFYSPEGSQYLYKKPIAKKINVVKKPPLKVSTEPLNNNVIINESVKIPDVVKDIVPATNYGVLKGEYSVNPRSKDTVPYSKLNPKTNKEWTPEEYSEYIDSERLKTAKYNEDIRNGKIKQLGGYSDEEILGYSDDSPHQDNPYIHINSNNISMAQTGIPLSLIPLDEDFNMLGQYDVDPYSGEYIFDGANSVLEIPNAQIGSRSPRHIETPEEKRIRMASYQRPGVNYGNAFINDIDNTMSREVNVPFVQNPSVMSNNTSKGVITNNNAKSPVTSKIKNKTVVSSNVKKPVTFWNEPTKAELEQQAIDYAPTIDKVDTVIPNDVFSNSTSVIEDPLTGMKKIIPGKPITLEYDNPLEAQAINYRKLKNSEVMSPYRGSMQLQTPSLYQESVDPYLANIKEQRNAVMQNINPNTSTGQAMLAGINANLVDASNKAIGEVNRNNMQNTTNWMNQVADIRNKQQSFDYENNRRYADEIAQLKAIQDEGDIAYMDSVANMNAKRLQAKNRFLTTAIETGLPSEALNIGDESVTFDVNKIPYQIYTRNTGANTPVNQKPIKMGDKYYDKVVENGRVRYIPVNIENKQLGGKMSKHKMYK